MVNSLFCFVQKFQLEREITVNFLLSTFLGPPVLKFSLPLWKNNKARQIANKPHEDSRQLKPLQNKLIVFIKILYSTNLHKFKYLSLETQAWASYESPSGTFTNNI